MQNDLVVRTMLDQSVAKVIIDTLSAL